MPMQKSRPFSRQQIFIIIAFAALILLFFRLELHKFLTLEYVKQQQDIFTRYYSANKWFTILAYSAVYITLTTVSFPGAGVLTLLAGALFGVWTGTLIVSVVSTVGATFAFLLARYVLREPFSKKFGGSARAFNEGLQKDGVFYLFALRLLPFVPFFVINTAMGLTSMNVWRYFWVSQLGMLPGTFVYVNAGTQLSRIQSLKEIISLDVLFSFALLGLFPLLAKKALAISKGRKVYRRFQNQKPRTFDYNIVAIGAGAGGLVTAYISAAVKAKVALVERHKMGGDCLNFGCVPSKALIRTARFLNDVKRAPEFAVRDVTAKFEFQDVMDRVHQKISEIAPHDSIERYTNLGVECIQGFAKILSPWQVEVNGRVLTTKNIVLATGAKPFLPQIKGLTDVQPLTSENLWELRDLPQTLLVLGGGYIGCELAQAFRRLGSRVVQLEQNDRLLGNEDPDVADFILQIFKKEGIEVLLGHKAVGFAQVGGKFVCEAQSVGGVKKIEFDRVLVALGRQARTAGFGLEGLGIETDDRGLIKVDEHLRTNIPNIYACGDCMSPYQFTHVAAHQAWHCAVNSMLSPFYSFKVNYNAIPTCLFTDPELASVGLNETRAQAQGLNYEVTVFDLRELDRAIVDDADEGFVKVLTAPGKDRILGVTIVGQHAGEYLGEWVTAMKFGLGLNKILGTVHAYPTYSESNKYAAGFWKKNHVNPRSLRFAEAFNRWRRR